MKDVVRVAQANSMLGLLFLVNTEPRNSYYIWCKSLNQLFCVPLSEIVDKCQYNPDLLRYNVNCDDNGKDILP